MNNKTRVVLFGRCFMQLTQDIRNQKKGVKPGGKAFFAVWFCPDQEDAKTRAVLCCRCLLNQQIRTRSHLRGVKPCSTAFCAGWFYAGLNWAVKCLQDRNQAAMLLCRSGFKPF